MSGEKSETEDTASWPKRAEGGTAASAPPAPAEAKTEVTSSVVSGEEKVSIFEGLATRKPRGSQAASTKTSSGEGAGDAESGKTLADTAPVDDHSTATALDAAKVATQDTTTAEPEEVKTTASPQPPVAATEAPKAPFATSDREMEPPAEPDSPIGATTPAKDPAPIAPPARRGGIMAPLLGGVLAAGLGFGLAHYVPEGWPIGPGADRLTALQKQIADQEARIAALSAQSTPAMDETLAPRLAALEEKVAQPSDLSGLAAEVEALKTRLASLPEGSAPADLTPLRNEMSEQIAALRAEIEAIPRSNPADLEALRAAAQAEREAIEARAEATRAEAEATARAAMIRGAALRLQAALETGSSFDAALADLTSAGVPLPEALSAHAAGVPALSTLQAEFPDVARAALTASTRPGPEAGIGDRFTAFLSSQTGLRSLSPQEGTDPDAVLSRAEAAVRGGDLGTALTELEALPPEGAALVAEWRAGAEARMAADQAVKGLIADFDKP